MIAIVTAHRRLAELTLKAKKLGGYEELTETERMEIEHCLHINADIVIQMDSLKQLALLAQSMGDYKWLNDLCGKLDELEIKCI